MDGREIRAARQSPVFVHNLMTAPAAATALRKGLRSRWPTSDLLRVVRELRSNASEVSDDEDVALFLAEPSTTGDLRWDVLLAGVAEDLARARGWPVPTWTAGRSLEHFWFVGSNEAFHAYALAHSPAALKIRGVMIDPADLESV